MFENYLSYTPKKNFACLQDSSQEVVKHSFLKLSYVRKMIFHTHNKSEENLIFYTHNKSPTLKSSLFFLLQNLLCVCTTHKLIRYMKGKEEGVPVEHYHIYPFRLVSFHWKTTPSWLRGFRHAIVG